MYSRSSSRLAALVASALFSSTLFAGTEVEVEVATGYDSNPFRASVNEQGGMYFDLDADVDFENVLSRTSLFFLSLDAGGKRFLGDVDDASNHSAGIETGMEFDLDMRGNDRFKLQLGASSDMRRGTYVSRFSGAVGEIGGTPIPDRFDYNRMGAFAESDYYLGRDIRFSLDVEMLDKNYVEDYTALGADRLDNTEWDIKPEFEYEFTDSWQVGVFAEFAKREYDDRPVDDANGTEIPGRNREYDYQEYGFEFQYKSGDSREWSFGYSTGGRQDNGGGYWDYDMSDYFVRLEQELASDAEFSVELYRTEKEYANVVIVTNPEEQYARTGNGLRLGYEREIHFGGTGDMMLFGELDYFDGSESSSRSAYKRTIAMVGLSTSF